MMESAELNRDCEVIAIPSGERRVLPQGTAVRILQARGGSYTVSNKFHALYRIEAADAGALGLEAPATAAPQPQGPLSEQLLRDVLKTVYDPEIPVDIVELGLIYSCAILPHEEGGKTVVIRMAMTSPGCGMSQVLKAEVESKVRRLPEVSEVRVEVVFDPPWNPDRMSEAARLQLGFDLGSGGTPRLTQIS
jgi:probable FeS assembly SUF system protein SufT